MQFLETGRQSMKREKFTQNNILLGYIAVPQKDESGVRSTGISCHTTYRVTAGQVTLK